MRKVIFLYVCMLIISNYLIAQTTDTLVDIRDGQKYKVVKISNQWWMTQNLNYQVKYGSSCYNDSDKYCRIYGKLYDWETAKNVCPTGWRLPNKNDFEILLNNVGENAKKQYNELILNGNSGFSSLFAGFEFSNDYIGLGKEARYWSTSEYRVTGDAFFLSINSEYKEASVWYFRPFSSMSVRCIKNE